MTTAKKDKDIKKIISIDSITRWKLEKLALLAKKSLKKYIEESLVKLANNEQ